MAGFHRSHIEDLVPAPALRGSFANDIENPGVANDNSEAGY